MSWIEKIQNSSDAKKRQVIWTILGITILVLLITWGLTTRLKHSLPKDTTLFQVLKKGIKDTSNNLKK